MPVRPMAAAVESDREDRTTRSSAAAKEVSIAIAAPVENWLRVSGLCVGSRRRALSTISFVDWRREEIALMTADSYFSSSTKVHCCLLLMWQWL